MKMPAAVAYYRTSGAANVGADKDSEAVAAYAKTAKLTVAAEFYDAVVSGTDPVDQGAGFVALLAHCAVHNVGVVLVENASRFARDLAAQLAGHALLRARHRTGSGGRADAFHRPDADGGNGAANSRRGVPVRKGRSGRQTPSRPRPHPRRDRPVRGPQAGARRGGGPCPARARKNPKTGAVRSLHQISGELAALGHVGADIWKIQQVSRHHSIQILSGYVRDARLFNNHAGETFL